MLLIHYSNIGLLRFYDDPQFQKYLKGTKTLCPQMGDLTFQERRGKTSLCSSDTSEVTTQTGQASLDTQGYMGHSGAGYSIFYKVGSIKLHYKYILHVIPMFEAIKNLTWMWVKRRGKRIKRRIEAPKHGLRS